MKKNYSFILISFVISSLIQSAAAQLDGSELQGTLYCCGLLDCDGRCPMITQKCTDCSPYANSHCVTAHASTVITGLFLLAVNMVLDGGTPIKTCIPAKVAAGLIGASVLSGSCNGCGVCLGVYDAPSNQEPQERIPYALWLRKVPSRCCPLLYSGESRFIRITVGTTIVQGHCVQGQVLKEFKNEIQDGRVAFLFKAGLCIFVTPEQLEVLRQRGIQMRILSSKEELSPSVFPEERGAFAMLPDDVANRKIVLLSLADLQNILTPEERETFKNQTQHYPAYPEELFGILFDRPGPESMRLLSSGVLNSRAQVDFSPVEAPAQQAMSRSSQVNGTVIGNVMLPLPGQVLE